MYSLSALSLFHLRCHLPELLSMDAMEILSMPLQKFASGGRTAQTHVSFQELIPFPEVSAWLNFENPHLYNKESKNQPGDSNRNAQLQLRHKAWHRLGENMRKYSRNHPLYMTHREYIAQSIVRSNKCTSRDWKIKSSFVWTILLGSLDILCPRLLFPSSFVRSERVSHDIAYNSPV